MRIAAKMTALALLGTAALGACGGSGNQNEGDDTLAESAAAQLIVHRSSRSGPGSVNSYWIEGEESVLVFDSQASPELAARFVEQIEASGKPVEAIFLSHYDVGSLAGLPALAAAFPGATIIASEDLQESIAEDPAGYIAAIGALYGEDYEGFPEIDETIADGDSRTYSGVEIDVHIVRDTESASIVMLAIPSQNVLLASDMIANGMHPDLVDADFDSWPRALQRLSRDFPEFTLYPGHGPEGPVNLLVANQSAYLNFMRALVENELIDDDVATEREIADALVQIRRNYPNWETTTGRPSQLRRNIDAMVVALGGELAVPRREISASPARDEPDE